jgi:hypothetical protein
MSSDNDIADINKKFKNMTTREAIETIKKGEISFKDRSLKKIEPEKTGQEVKKELELRRVQ